MMTKGLATFGAGTWSPGPGSVDSTPCRSGRPAGGRDFAEEGPKNRKSRELRSHHNAERPASHTPGTPPGSPIPRALCLAAMLAVLSGCLAVDVKKFVSEGVTLASEQTYAHLSKPEVRTEIIDETVDRAALAVRVEANRQYDEILLDLKTPGLTWRKLLGFLITIGGLLAS